jgi:uncharacterized protein
MRHSCLLDTRVEPVFRAAECPDSRGTADAVGQRHDCNRRGTTAGAMSDTEDRMTVTHIEILEAEIAKVCQRNGIRKLALFGSVLTDRFSESSDIDVLVEFQPDAHVGFFRLVDIENELSRLLGGRRVDLRTPMDLSRHFRDQVVRDALPVYAES